MKVVLYDSFEDGFYDQDGAGELTIPNGWRVTWRHDPKEGVLDRPEMDQEYTGDGDTGIRTGRYGSKMALAYATFDACLYRQLGAMDVGKVVTAEVWTRFYTRNAGNNNTGAINMCIGIDPYGGTDMESPAVIWSNWIGEDSDKDWHGEGWRPLRVEVTAKSTEVTVFLRGMCRWAVTTSAVFFDDVTVEAEADSNGGEDTALRELLSASLKQLITILYQLEEAL